MKHTINMIPLQLVDVAIAGTTYVEPLFVVAPHVFSTGGMYLILHILFLR